MFSNAALCERVDVTMQVGGAIGDGNPDRTRIKIGHPLDSLLDAQPTSAACGPGLIVIRLVTPRTPASPRTERAASQR